jgi:uncharacterized protein YndB with AHSA1/START domain
MSKPKPQFTPPAGPAPVAGAPAGGKDDRPGFQSLDRAEENLPRLQVPGAWTVARDRWERLVTTSIIPAPVEQVWRALTDPAEMKRWLAVCQGSLEQPHCDCVLDFEDGEFFLCRSTEVRAPYHLQYLWRWLGIGQATSVTWDMERFNGGTKVTVTEEAFNPPWDWQTWNGGGWPGILDQLATYLRTGLESRWPWRRMGPYVQVELPVSVYEAWDRLSNPSGLKYWLLSMQGNLTPGGSLQVLMGDASGAVEMNVREIIQPGQSAPSFLPYMTYSLKRHAWNCEVGGRLWIEPAGWGRSLLQVFHYNWENLPSGLQLSERRIMTGFWAGALARARMMCGGAEIIAAPHNW